MSFTKRREAIIRCGSDLDLVLIFNADLKRHHLTLSKGIPLHVFSAIVYIRDPHEIILKYPEYTFYQVLEWFEKVRERNQGELPAKFIEQS